MEFTHEEILKLLQDRKDKIVVTRLAESIGISQEYLSDVINERKINGKPRKLHKKHFNAVIEYLNGLAVKDFVGNVADEILQ